MFLNAITGPFLGSLAAGLGGRWLGARGSGVLTVLGLGTSALCSVGILLEVLMGGCPVIIDMGSWFQGSTVHVSWIFAFDSLTACMMVTVTLVSFCVHIYSLGYMQNDPHLPRFMSYLSLFTGGMLLLVSASDFITLLVGWELIGVCSYLLIGFWFHRLSATKAAQKAVLVNRVSDTALMVGLMASWWYLGSTDLSLLVATSTSAAYTDFLCAMLLTGALGKSAQIGLHVWLADAMEGLVFIIQWTFLNMGTKCTLTLSMNTKCALAKSMEEHGSPSSKSIGMVGKFVGPSLNFAICWNTLKLFLRMDPCIICVYCVTMKKIMQWTISRKPK